LAGGTRLICLQMTPDGAFARAPAFHRWPMITRSALPLDDVRRWRQPAKCSQRLGYAYESHARL
jgi:hypothetical protein